MMSRERNYKSLLLTALLVGAVSTASAGTPCGYNLEYEMDGTTVVLTSPDPTLPATIYSQAFMDHTYITAVLIPDNVTTISSYAFFGCTSLTEVVIPPSVTNIDNYAFYGCSSLTSVLCRPTIAPTLGTDAFTNCNASLQICVYKLGGTGGYNSTDWYTSYADNLTLCFLDENDEPEATSGQISTFRLLSRTNIDIFRTLRKAGCFNTLTLPFDVPNIASSPLVGAEVYEFVGATVVDDALQLDITPLAGSSLTAGTPYLIQWPNTGEVMTRMTFTGISWDTNETADDAGTGQVTFHGFYGKTHIDDATSGEQHLNLFLGGNNTLYWPTDGDDPDAKMYGFRAWFKIEAASGAKMNIRRGMPASFHIVNTPTDIESIQPSAVSIQKELRDGRIIIIRNGEKYSITGQKL